MAEEFDGEDALLEVDWGDSPSDAELADARMETTLQSVDRDEVVPDAARELGTVMSDIHVNGDAHLGVVRVPPNDALDWHLSRGGRKEWLYRDVLASDALSDALPALDLSPDRHPQDYTDLDWEHYSAYTLDGHLARHLVGGGAYYNFLEPPFHDVDAEIPGYEHVPESYGDRGDAKRLGERFVEAVFGERYGEFSASATFDRWCDWFESVAAWDVTYVCFDQRTRLAWVFVVTGAD
ncbi:hypothetical protein M0R88_10120 [Halorussus gelatinilyticus]|uniref:Uncharacterized protein n=1 Tax=Halorussus gelatinilyticus TaxID=2937524 RepID=A0A8U0IDB0_9EURY|nr:hypothetical protein [Halorussus gelatinilyticus]UPV98887.1 hypothetical protein M0R88_10120 [Halorussus gelatinilyticus]